MELVRQVAALDGISLLAGETGTDKIGLVCLVHECSRRRDVPFLVINLRHRAGSLAEA